MTRFQPVERITFFIFILSSTLANKPSQPSFGSRGLPNYHTLKACHLAVDKGVVDHAGNLKRKAAKIRDNSVEISDMDLCQDGKP
jgi:hypothetical protein